MQCMTLDDLRTVGLPPRMPSATEIGVWKRSTGFEVILPCRLGFFKFALLALGLVVLVLLVVWIALLFPGQGVQNGVILYSVLSIPILVYIAFLAIKFSENRKSKIRIDMTPLKLTFTHLNSAGLSKRINEIPIQQIQDVCIDARRGIRINGKIAEMSYGMWIGRGLKPDDLYYLTCVIGQVTTLSAQNANARIQGSDEEFVDVG